MRARSHGIREEGKRPLLTLPLSDWARGTKARLRSLCVTGGYGRQGRRYRARFPVCMASSVVFQNLEADDFRHPLDKQNTLLLSMIPGLNELGKALLGPVAEQFMILENIGTSVLVSENQLSNLHQLLLEAAKVLSIEPPDLYLRQNPVPNAYTLAISGKKPFIVVHTSLVELLSKKELQM